MTENPQQKLKDFHVRAAVPKYLRFGAIGLVAIAIIAVMIGFYRNSGNAEFRMKGFPTALSKDVVATVENYERREMEGDAVRYYVRADRAMTFSDNHQELENVFIEVFNAAGSSDKINAQKAVYVPGENKSFTAYLAGDVKIETRDQLIATTANLTYDHATETAKAEEAVDFERANVRGSSVGAVIDAANKRLDLLSKVRIETSEGAEGTELSVGPATMNSDRATYEQYEQKISLNGSVHIETKPGASSGNTSVIKANSANAFLVAQGESAFKVDRVELFENVNIESRPAQGQPTTLTANYALFRQPEDRFELRGSANIVTAADDKTTTIRGEEAVYLRGQGKVTLSSNAEITQGGNFVSGDKIEAELFPDRKVRSARSDGNGYLKQTTAERTTEVRGTTLNVAFDGSENPTSAAALGNAFATIVPVKQTEYTMVTMSAPQAVKIAFKSGGLLNTMQTEGRTTIQLDVPETGADAANKRITADTVKTQFDDAGKFLQRAEAVGNAELLVAPHKALPANYSTAISAPQFDCGFFPGTNNAKSCTAFKKVTAVRTPTVQATARGKQTVTSEKMIANFSDRTKDVETLEANGNAKFTELDRNASASAFTFSYADQILRLRGSEPTAWDSRARAKAPEIDWDTANQRSFLRGGVSTTYYSQRSTGGATPFRQTDKPVYITASDAEFDHARENAVYTGNARAWQENNYVRGQTLFIDQKAGLLTSEGNVESSVSDIKRKDGDRETKIPVFASANKLRYTQRDRHLRYEESVDIRQGPDRIRGAAASIFMNERDEVVQTDVETAVTITQPGRSATGSFARYVAENESVFLKGDPAKVVDARNGTSQGAELTFFMRENRVVGEGRTAKDPSGRVRSVYKIKNNE